MRMMCRLLKVSHSGYYNWRGRVPSKRALRDQELMALLKDIFTEHDGRYGVMRIWKEMNARKVSCGRDRVGRLMRKLGLRAKARRRRNPRTTDSEHAHPVAKNLLKREFAVDGPDLVWLADITYLATAEGWMYLSVVMDLCTRRIVGWSVRDSLHRQGALDALEIALANRTLQPGAIHHSDRGVQYASTDYRQRLEEAGLACSMSRKGNCWDNAPMESFFGRMKEEIGVELFETKAAARQAAFKYIEAYYNRTRRHSGLDYLSPDEFEQQLEKQSVA